MIKKIITYFLFVFIISCSNIEFVLKDSDSANPLKNNVLIEVSGKEKDRYIRGLYSYFGSNKNNGYILVTSIVEKKENRVIKKNQVAEKIDYKLNITYNLYYKNRGCKIMDKKIITKFTFTPKSFGYNFGADRSFEKQYSASIKKNIQSFISFVPTEINCLK